MPDVLYTTVPNVEAELARTLRTALPGQAVATSVSTFTGPWGSLAIGRGPYQGWDPIDEPDALVAIVGGPVVRSEHVRPERPDCGTAAVLRWWRRHDDPTHADWTVVLGGGFIALIVDKVNSRVHAVTDMLLFVPLYQHVGHDRVILASHAEHAIEHLGRPAQLDPIAACDVISNRTMTHPWTLYEDVRQAEPASVITIHTGSPDCPRVEQHAYWQPAEQWAFDNVEEAAATARNGLRDHVSRVVEQYCGDDPAAAMLMSAGEDSRLLLGMLRELANVDCYTIADSYNREARLAHRVAQKYGAPWRLATRDDEYAVRLFRTTVLQAGGHVEALNHHFNEAVRALGLGRYPAVIGGAMADTILKGVYSPVRRYRFAGVNVPIVRMTDNPARWLDAASTVAELIDPEVQQAVRERQAAKLERMRDLRPNSALEWMWISPIAHGAGSAKTYQGTRKLFAAFEPFTDPEVIRVAAGTPPHWKVNRRLFHRIVAPVMGSAGMTPRGNGMVPAFGPAGNLVAQPLVRIGWRVRDALASNRSSNNDSWPDYRRVVRSESFRTLLEQQIDRETVLDAVFTDGWRDVLRDDARLSPKTRFMALQILLAADSLADRLTVADPPRR